MRGFVLGLCAAAFFGGNPALAQLGGSIGAGDSGAVRVPSFRDSDLHRHYWIPPGALGPARGLKQCRVAILRKRSTDGSVVTRRTRRCE